MSRHRRHRRRHHRHQQRHHHRLLYQAVVAVWGCGRCFGWAWQQVWRAESGGRSRLDAVSPAQAGVKITALDQVFHMGDTLESLAFKILQR